jgi:rod shape-determining protein MreC
MLKVIRLNQRHSWFRLGLFLISMLKRKGNSVARRILSKFSYFSLAQLPGHFYGFFLLSVFAWGLAIIDVRSHFSEPLRSLFFEWSSDVQAVTSLPTHWWMKNQDLIQTEMSLLKKNKALETELFQLKGRLQDLLSVEADNQALRALVQMKNRLPAEFKVAQVIGKNPDVFKQEIIVNLGAKDGVKKGFIALDHLGLIGQVVRVSDDASQILLLTDPVHALPVQNQKNGLDAVLVGTGSDNKLALMNVPVTADIQKGDTWITSGLEERFPFGYPVGEVSHIHRGSGETFAEISVKPYARFSAIRRVLIRFKEDEVERQEGLTPVLL